MLRSVAHEPDFRVDLQRLHDVVLVNVHRVVRDAELIGNLSLCLPFADKADRPQR